MAAAKPPSLALICGDDEFAVKQRAKQIYQQWCEEFGGMDHEIIEATVANSGEALTALARLREALQTLPFFGAGKVVWLRDCNFLGDERAASRPGCHRNAGRTGRGTEEFSPGKMCGCSSARAKWTSAKPFSKRSIKSGRSKAFPAGRRMTGTGRNGRKSRRARPSALRQKEISEEALAELVSRVGPNPRQLDNEIEKLCLFAGDRKKIEVADVAAICTRNKTARAFALGDALGDRDLPRLLRRLDEELWEIKFDSQKSEIGLLYGLIAKVRAMLLLKEMLREGWIKPEMDYNRFKAQLERVPADKLPADKRFNPLALNPYVLYKALPQVKKYSQSELVRAMDLLLRCNQRLVSSGLDETLVLQQALVQIVAPQASRPEL